MKIQIRQGTFETNSSSTHSLVLCKANDVSEWKKGNKYFCFNENKFYSLEEGDVKREEFLNKYSRAYDASSLNEIPATEYPATYDEFNDCDIDVESATLDNITGISVYKYDD